MWERLQGPLGFSMVDARETATGGMKVSVEFRRFCLRTEGKQRRELESMGRVDG
jgi:hypothetical protein